MNHSTDFIAIFLFEIKMKMVWKLTESQFITGTIYQHIQHVPFSQT